MDSTKSKKILYQGKWLQFCQDGRWEWIERVGCSGVVIVVAVNDQGKLILVEQYRRSVDQNMIELPAGLVNDEERDHETMEEAAKRELLEETGYQADRLELLCEGPPSAGLSSEIISFYLATNLKKVSDGGGDEHEAIVVHEVLLSEVEEWLEMRRKEGKGVDPKIYVGLYFLKKSPIL